MAALDVSHKGPPANGVAKLSKRALARARKKATRAELQKQENVIVAKLAEEHKEDEKQSKVAVIQEIEYVAPDDLEEADNHPQIDEFKRIFANFAKPEELTAERKEEDDEEKKEEKPEKKTEGAEGAIEAVVEEKGLSKRELKARNRLSIAELKQLVAKPDVVEFHDANSADPKLLVHLKAYRNTVPVPTHWSQKRKYLQSKRGYEKPPFELPQFIADTGISQIRMAQQEREDMKKNKQKQREKMQPKTGGLDIDYQILHDAFFRFQVKPDLTHFGNVYYEGRELEVKLKAKRPGDLSEELKRALGMTDTTSPPPWLFNIQRFGPPPSYPKLKLPGCNCPIPPGARYGFGPGEWGKPPVDEYGRPLYGDVFGTAAATEKDNVGVDKTHWAELNADQEEEEDEDEDDDNEDEDDDDMESGMESVSSMTSSGMETPESIQLRKEKEEDTTTEGSSQAPKSLYTVLDEKKSGVGASQLFGSQHTYVLPTNKDSESEKRVAAAKSKASEAVNVNLNPEDLENLDAVTLKRKYEAQLEAENMSKRPPSDDVSDVIEENRLKKRKTVGKDKKKQKYKF